MWLSIHRYNKTAHEWFWSWRLMAVTTSNSQRYTFISSVHHSHSHIDLFPTSNLILSEISDSKIKSIIISDHALITFTWDETGLQKHSTRCCLSTSLLHDPEFNSYFEEEWASFLEIKDSPKSSPMILWETGKAVFSYYTLFRKRRRSPTRTKN